MRRTIALLVLMLAATSTALAWTSRPLREVDVPSGSWTNDLPPAFSHTRDDTVWFGGTDTGGVAIEGGIWDFEDVTLQSWSSIDQTLDPAVYFGRVTEQDFLDHEDPCQPMFAGSIGQLWCGIHQDEANQRDFIGGMGYQNSMCQRAFSPQFDFDGSAENISVSFIYFNDTEPGFDYTFVYLLGYDAEGELIDEIRLERFDGLKGTYDNPEAHANTYYEPDFDDAVVTAQIEFRMVADGGYSDEDGSWDTECGPFAADDVAITATGGHSSSYGFEDGAEGWTFDRCLGVGSYMHLVDEAEFNAWMAELGLICGCGLDGTGLGFNSTICDDGPGIMPGSKEMALSPPVYRSGYEPPAYNDIFVEYDFYVDFPHDNGSGYRPGYMIYPYTTEVNPDPHWSPRLGQETYFYLEGQCYLNQVSLSQMADAPLPAEWDSLRYCFEIWSSCDGFGIPSTVCLTPGCSRGSPVLDNIRVGMTGAGVDAPSIRPDDGMLLQDGFGQNFPSFLEPSDLCNSNVALDHSRSPTPSDNDWNADSSVVSGPRVSSEAGRWLADICFRIAQKGPRQDMVPEYHTWLARLGGDPEADFVCVLMDSVQSRATGGSVSASKFATYFHEDDSGFDDSYADYMPEQEILPDMVFVPGTVIEYYWRAYWYNGGAPPPDYYTWASAGNPREFALLPGMRLTGADDFEVEWPSVLYIDVFNAGVERFINPLLDQLQIPYDKFDYQDAASNWHAAIKRTYGGDSFNPGGWGNNGCTTDQLLGYRLILLNTGLFGVGAMEEPDFVLLEDWIESTECDLGDARRALILDGDQIVELMDEGDGTSGLAIDFAHNTLGVTLDNASYREANIDTSYCVEIVQSAGGVFGPNAPGVRLWNNGCPGLNNYNTLAIHPGSGATGNMSYFSYLGQGTVPIYDFAEIINTDDSPTRDWRSVVNGFSLHHLSEIDCGAGDCDNDSLCISLGAADVLGPILDWVSEGDPDMFDMWLYPCTDVGVDEDGQTHLTGKINHLYMSRPNPFNTRATIRFSLAHAGHVDIDVFDVAGRLVRTLVDEELEAGENAVLWDGTDNDGTRVAGGVFWMQMSAQDGYASGKKMLVLR